MIALTPVASVATLHAHAWGENQHGQLAVSPPHAVGKVHVVVTTSGGSSTAVTASEFKYKKK
jgi:hypothetical protein